MGARIAFGPVVELSSLNGRNGFQISGKALGYVNGRSVSSAGDVNGDGFDDVIIGADNADPNGRNSGASYVVFGQADGFKANLSLPDMGSLRISRTADGTDRQSLAVANRRLSPCALNLVMPIVAPQYRLEPLF